MNGLTIYRSSAGSGKTYTLVKTYLSLMFILNDDYGFKQILGITFTNKAANEMKTKVFDALEKITIEGSKNKLAIEIANENDINIDHLVKRSRSIYHKILHNFGDFNLMTIDKFSNQIIRSFSDELGLSSSYEVILEEKDFLEEAISEFIDDSSMDTFHLDVIHQFIDESIRQGVNNDIEKQLKKLNKIIFDSGKISNKILDQKDLFRLRNHVVNSIKKSELYLDELFAKASDLLNQFNIDSSWSSHSRIDKMLNSNKNLKIIDFEELEKWSLFTENDQWFKKSLKKNQLIIIDQIKGELYLLINQIIEIFHQWLKAIEIHKFITPFSMVQSLINKIEIKKKQTNSILISDFNFLISDIIKQEPAGYIFERIGNRYQYILVDEFQDTSKMQWDNLIPLIHESISNGGKNLIVGDAKQAIYRWRNGNVKQFIDLPYLSDEYLKENYEFLFVQSKEEKVLKNNWRSSSNIIEFNNWLFENVAQLTGLRDVINSYMDVRQNIIRDFEGVVNINIKIKGEFDFNKYIKSKIEKVLSQGYQYSDITFVFRSKKDGIKIIKALEELAIPFVSEDSIFLSSSISYKVLFHGLNYLEFNSKNDYKFLIHFLSVYFKDQENDFEKIKLELSNFSNDNFNQLYDFQKLQYCIDFFKLNTKDPYVDVFLDTGLMKLKDDHFTIGELLNFFKDNSNKITVENGPVNAVELMTIHKSKGLEFPVVIIPFASWPNRKSTDPPLVWLNDIEIDNQKINNYFAELSKKSLNHIGEKQVFQLEELASVLDNINLFYVAFTRAADQLHIAMDDTNSSSSVSDLLNNCIKNHDLYDNDKQEILIEGLNSNLSISNMKNEILINESDINNQILNLNNHKIQDYFSFVEKPNLGTVFHEAISKVYDNFFCAYDYLEMLSNKQSVDQKTIMQCVDYIKKIESSKDLSFIYSNYETVYNEREIVDEKGDLLRIDRIIFKDNEAIIIDYKTSSELKEDYKVQVKKYINSIKSLGFNNVSGYLLFIPELKLFQVD